MGPKDVILSTLDMSDFILKKYLDDLSDADLRLRPVEGMNPIALQFGHLIASERHFVEMIKPGASPPLPAGFTETLILAGAVPPPVTVSHGVAGPTEALNGMAEPLEIVTGCASGTLPPCW